MAVWLKLDTGILDDEKIRIIRDLPDGDTLFVLWIGILCLAMKKETESLYIADGIPYEDTHLSTLYNIKIDTVKLGLSVFERLGMVTRYSNGGALHVTHLTEHQALQRLDRQRLLTSERVRKHRQRKQIDNADVTRYSVTCNATEEEVEEEVDIIHEPFAEDFEAAWKAYPRKKNRKGAYKAYCATRRKGVEAGELLGAVTNFAREMSGKVVQFVMHGATFFGSNERWRDSVATKVSAVQYRKVCEVCAGEFIGEGLRCPSCK